MSMSDESRHLTRPGLYLFVQICTGIDDLVRDE